MNHIEFDLKIDEYPSFTKHDKFFRFYEELESCLKELKKILDIVEILQKKKSENFSNIFDKFNEITERNYEIIKLNFNYMQGLLNLFKFNDEAPIQKFLKQVYFFKLYFFLYEQFNRLRKSYPDYYFFKLDEENRYLDSLKSLYYKKSNFQPSKSGFLYLRHVRFYIFKINKHLFKSDSEWKLSFYVKNRHNEIIYF
jgi:hypothetical protein